MAAISRDTLHDRESLLRSIATGGLIVFVIQILDVWIASTIIQGIPFVSVWQYIASGLLGMPAFEGGLASASLGLFLHLLISLAVAAIFIMSAKRLPIVRRNVIVSSLLYGLVVWIVMNLIVTPLSATPAVPAPTTPWLIEAILEHVFGVGLALGILVRRRATTAWAPKEASHAQV